LSAGFVFPFAEPAGRKHFRQSITTERFNALRADRRQRHVVLNINEKVKFFVGHFDDVEFDGTNTRNSVMQREIDESSELTWSATSSSFDTN
jgi:hypothetical protein